MDPVVVVNENDEVVGTMPRGEAHKNGTPHRIAIVFVENEKGEILIQVRMSGTLDHSAAGHVDPGESYLVAAQRELMEELGIENIELISIGKGRSDEIGRKEKGDTELEHRIHVFEVFLCQAEPGVLSRDEVKSVYWANPEVVLEEMQESPEKFAGAFKVSLPIYLKWKASASH
jgi:isopentenyl-diphosphate delta-isomerase